MDDEIRSDLAEQIYLRVWETISDPEEIIEILGDEDPDLSDEDQIGRAHV